MSDPGRTVSGPSLKIIRQKVEIIGFARLIKKSVPELRSLVLLA
jgi:hypothetical protein